MLSKPNNSGFGILPDSPSRMVNSPEFRQKCQEIRNQVLSKFEEESSRASFLKRCWLKWRAERLVSLEIRKISPSDYAI
jgi:hypothetical protein